MAEFCRKLSMFVTILFLWFQVDGAAIRGNPLKDVQADLYKLFFNNNISENFETPGETTQIRKHFLYNMCSEKFVKVFRKGRRGIHAKGKNNSKNMDFSKYFNALYTNEFFLLVW